MSTSLRRRIPVGVVAGVAVALVMACGTDGREEDDTQYRQDVIWCEEAVARLEECCGSTFDPELITCRHHYVKDTGCTSTSISRVDPAYTLAESECVRDQSCETIRANKICERALVAGQARVAQYRSNDDTLSSSSTSSTSGSSATGPICP